MTKAPEEMYLLQNTMSIMFYTLVPFSLKNYDFNIVILKSYTIKKLIPILHSKAADFHKNKPVHIETRATTHIKVAKSVLESKATKGILQRNYCSLSALHKETLGFLIFLINPRLLLVRVHTCQIQYSQIQPVGKV